MLNLGYRGEGIGCDKIWVEGIGIFKGPWDISISGHQQGKDTMACMFAIVFVNGYEDAYNNNGVSKGVFYWIKLNNLSAVLNNPPLFTRKVSICQMVLAGSSRLKL